MKAVFFSLMICLETTAILATTWKHSNYYRKQIVAASAMPSDFKDMWFEQHLDHFDHTNLKTWKQRYQKNDQMYSSGGPILLSLGGEGPANPIWMTNGIWYDIAQRYHGVMFQLEHRFYGESHPTNDCTVQNLRFLSSEQALADAASFITWLRSIYGNPGQKVYVFGGSYSGALSAWLRQRYPFLVDGSLSASGPYLAQVNFPEYEETVRYVCETAVSNCFGQVDTLLYELPGFFFNMPAKVKETFKLCNDPDTKDMNDFYSLVSTLLDPFDEAVQYGDDNREFEGAHPVFKNAKEVCGNMTSQEKALDGMAQVVAVYLNGTQQKCLDSSYSSGIKLLSSTDWSSDGVKEGARQWMWQTCTEFGYYQTIPGTLNISSPLPLSFYLQQCNDIFGKVYGDPSFVNASANNTNTEYGGLNLKASNTIIFNGNYDPWSTLSITWPLVPNHETYTLLVPGAAHCAILYPATYTDSPALQAARTAVIDIFGQWITGRVPPDAL